jgi:protein-tyrosine phosphatase
MKYAIVFIGLGASLLINAIIFIHLPVFRILVGWIGFTFTAVGIAFSIGWPGIFGKRGDGTLRPLNLVVLFPYFLLSWIIWRTSVALIRESAYDRIDDYLVCGRRLLPHEVLPKVDAVIDLTAEFPETAALRGQGYRCLPILDAHALDVERLAEAAYRIGRSTKSVFVHCAQGHGRTGMFAAIVLMARDPALTIEGALAKLQEKRPGIGISRVQRQSVEQAAAWIKTTYQRERE